MNDPDQTVDHLPLEDTNTEAPLTRPTKQIGRYRIVKLLGRGGFGLVYLAHDEQLQRLVAIKVPHRKLVDRTQAAEAYLIEARTVAKLDHPNIVPVHDVGSTRDYPCYIVTKYIDGTNLASSFKRARLSILDAVELVAIVADALHHAHKQGLVHRDVKPGNILLDKQGKPFVADFGLALREQDVGKGPSYTGTPAYMSPEQARGEGHRVDGRSDIFSLGVVFYELLVGHQPFRAESQDELMEQVTNLEPRPPRQYDEKISKELERICLKALSKRASDRYTTAKDMAEDLLHFLSDHTISQQFAHTSGFPTSSITPFSQPTSNTTASGRSTTPVTTPSSGQESVKIVPRGLRSFDAHDADFFLELLPGPRDRGGLPDNVCFWKTRIEETDADNTFTVGLIYGPSGCGKSSLVKAGLLPRLSDHVIAIYVEATAEETETRLVNGLRKRCPAMAADMGLKETLAEIRRGQGSPAGKKVVIILDQFEQWLHARKEETNTELVQALRHCDGGKVQCLVMVRDDFWMAATRFMRELEVRLLEGQNSAVIDLFDIDHARKVLAAFGRAFDKLPEKPSDTTRDQKEFLRQAVTGLAQEGKVVCVRLALFAEMMKGKAWTPASLKAVGGTEGVGVTFLEETFSATTAPPEHRYHQKAARAVLKALLPETGTDIKGHMRSHAELLEASGHSNRLKDFDDLIHILDSEIRLITPTDPEGKEDTAASSSIPGQKYYQLSHDYLVHSLREWLTRKQKETRRGRTELLLADRAAVWNTRPENRQLPSLLQWASIRWLTAKRNWSPQQQKMMSKANRYHAMQAVVLVALISLLGIAAYEGQGWLQAHALCRSLLDANTAQVPAIVADMASYRRWIDPLLHEAASQAEASKDTRKQLHASLALLPVDATQVDYLYGKLLEATPQELPVIRDALTANIGRLLGNLWAVIEKPQLGKESQRLRAAAGLAKYDPENEKWAKVAEAVVNDLVSVPAVYLASWMDAFRPVRAKLLTPLSDVYGSTAHRDVERALATDILVDYAADQPPVMANLLMDADEKQFSVIYPKLKEHGEQGLPLLTLEIDKKVAAALPSSDDKREKLAKRQANAAVALLRMSQPVKVWPLLQHSPDPRVRSYLIHKLGPLGVDPKTIVSHLDATQDLSIRRALLLSLGEYGENVFTPDDWKALLGKLQEMYRTEVDPGLHAACEWLLRIWKQEAWLNHVNHEWAKSKELRLERICKTLAKDKEKTPPQWYVNGQGQTMVVIPGPVTIVMGSPVNEAERQDSEKQHKKRIGRTFAIAAKSVTVEQFRQFNKAYTLPAVYTRAANMPVAGTSWFQAVAYCNWLSKEEGIPEDQWCYEINGEVTKLKEKYLSLSGYRLPTEAEMEYATRAGAITSRFYGETVELLARYGWYQKNSQEKTWPVGSLKPNDLGLFDVHGNVFTWCQESFKHYPAHEGEATTEDLEGSLVIKSTESRVVRGGTFYVLASSVRSSYRADNAPTIRINSFGFRLARTVPLSSMVLPPTEGKRQVLIPCSP